MPTTSITDAVVRGRGTVEDYEMPFLNRRQEVWDLFRINAENIVTLERSDAPITNFRLLQLLFCVQYFGSGKTTLGQMFPLQINNPDVIQFFNEELESASDNEKLQLQLHGEWQKLQAAGIQHIMFDVRSCSNIVRYAAKLCASSLSEQAVDSIAPDIEPLDAAQYLIDFARKNEYTLFHFDEVGSADHDINSLRQLAVAVWQKMWLQKKQTGKMPRIFFFVTGKSTEPFEGIGHGATLSPCASYFLVLDMLAQKHVRHLRQHLQDEKKVENPLVLRDFDEVACGDHLDECLLEATGGAPRLLLYTLRALHVTGESLSSNEQISNVLYGKIFPELYNINDVMSEFRPATDESFAFLFSFTLQRTRLKMTAQVRLRDRDTFVYQLLRFQPFFLSRDDRQSEDEFILHLPRFHLMAAEDTFRPDSIPMLMMSMAGSSSCVAEPWRIFELFPAHIVATKAAYSLALKKEDNGSWADALPELLGKSTIARQARFDLGPEPFRIFHEKGSCPKVIESNPEAYVGKGAVFPRDKSSSADEFHVQRQLDGKDHILLEWQMKLLASTSGPLTMKTVSEEVGKSAETLKSVLIVFSASVGPQLAKAMTDNVLMLRSWDKSASAKYAFSNSGLLWKPSEEEDDVYSSDKQSHSDEGESGDGQGIEVNLEEDGDWYVYPGDQVAAKAPIKNSARVLVRPGLEVVIPHHDLVKELAGPTMFESLIRFEQNRGESSSVGAVITCLNEVLSRKHKQSDMEKL